jgi:hypothetical protein
LRPLIRLTDKLDNKEETSEAVKAASFFSNVWPKVRDLIIKGLIVRWIPRAVGGVWGWIAVVVIDYLAKPLYDYTVRKIIVAIRKIKHNQEGRKLEESKTETDFNSASDDLP